MSLRMTMLRLRRRSSFLLVLSVLACLAVMVILSLCHVPCEHHSKRTVAMETALPEKKDIFFATNLLIIVISEPMHCDVRNVIRETWAHELPNGVTVKFVVGSKSLGEQTLADIEQESKFQGDLVMLNDLEESYSSLTKKLLFTLKWVDQHVKYNFLMKVDEDSFVRADKVLDELLSKPQERLYWGFFDGRAHVKKTGKWAEKDFLLCDRYLPYALGGGYVLSKDLVNYIARNSDILKLLNSEDVSVGMWLGPLDINRIHDVNFDTEYKSRGCYNSYLVTHKKSVEELKQLYSNLKSQGHLCDKETRVRLSYNYNWDNLPTQCCERTDPNIP